MHHATILEALAARAANPDPPDRATLHARLVLAALDAGLPEGGLSRGQLAAALVRRFPLAFAGEEAFSKALDELQSALRDALVGGDTGQLRVIGTAATLFTLHPHKDPHHHFDARPADRSDLDLGLESPALFSWLMRHGAEIEPSPINALGTVSAREVRRLRPDVAGWLDRWGRQLQRRIEVVVPGGGRPRLEPSLLDITRPLGPALADEGHPGELPPAGAVMARR